MKDMWLLVYKCRLCGEIYTNSGGIFDLTDAVVELCREKSNNSGLVGIHMCKNGSLGVSDLQGLVPEKEWFKCSGQANITK